MLLACKSREFVRDGNYRISNRTVFSHLCAGVDFERDHLGNLVVADFNSDIFCGQNHKKVFTSPKEIENDSRRNTSKVSQVFRRAGTQNRALVFAFA